MLERHSLPLLALLFAIATAPLIGCEDSSLSSSPLPRCDPEAAEAVEPAPFEEPTLHAVAWGQITRFYSTEPIRLQDRGFVAVGSANASFVTVFGDVWMHRTQPREIVLYDFDATGVSDLTVASDGLHFLTRYSTAWHHGGVQTENALLSVTHSPTHIVAVGEEGLVLSGSDGLEFEQSRIAGARNLQDVVWATGQFMTADDAGRFWISDDGSLWDELGVPPLEALDAFAVSGERIFAVTQEGDLFSYAAGGEWTAVETPACMRNVVVEGGRIFAVGDYGNIMHSADGEDWIHSWTGSRSHLLDLAYGEGVFVAVGRDAEVLHSVDLQEWDSARLPRPHSLTNAYWTGTEYHLISFGHRFETRRGETWDRQTDYGLGLDGVVGPRGVVVVGHHGAIQYSADGESWEWADSATDHNLEAVVWTRDRYVAVGHGGTFVVSEDGLSWSALEYQSDGSFADRYFADLLPLSEERLLAVAVDGTLVEFDSEWNASTRHIPSASNDPGSDYALRLALLDGDVFVLRRWAIFRSSDLEQWNESLRPVERLVSFAGNGDEIVAVGTRGRVSRLGRRGGWSEWTLSPYDLNFVVWGDAGWMVGGDEGEMFVSRGDEWESRDIWGLDHSRKN